MAEPQARYDLIAEIMAGVVAYKTAHPSAGIVTVTPSENAVLVGLSEKVGNLTLTTQFNVSL